MGLVSAVGFYLGQGGEGTGKQSYGGSRPTRCDSKKPKTGDNDPECKAGWCADRPLQRDLGRWGEVRFGGDGICGGGRPHRAPRRHVEASGCDSVPQNLTHQVCLQQKFIFKNQGRLNPKQKDN